jgi:hypothetical protein
MPRHKKDTVPTSLLQGAGQNQEIQPGGLSRMEVLCYFGEIAALLVAPGAATQTVEAVLFPHISPDELRTLQAEAERWGLTAPPVRDS